VSGVTARPAGDRALLLEVPGTEEALRVAQRLKEACPELTDVVPGHRTVLAIWEQVPGTDLAALAADALSVPGTAVPGTEIEIGVTYDGPDLAAVAAQTGLSPQEVVTRHTAADYLVAFIGFAPGFAYLVGGDERLAVPRRPEPREHVPGGSVGIAGPYTGIYPRESPGGWQLLGRTDTVMFDPRRDPPACLAPGDHVRLVAR
jgi:KipI family sensor histidine kinase inhibitor